MPIVELLNSIFRIFGIRVVKSRNQELISNSPHLRSGSRWMANCTNSSLLYYVKRNIIYSNSQLEQDLFVAWTIDQANKLNLLQPKYFVEFGATNGYRLSNTFYLEKYLNWNGLLAEPAHIWHAELKTVRNCRIDLRCVYNKSGQQVIFKQTQDPELGTISTFENSDSHLNRRISGIYYEVETVSLLDLLEQHQAPHHIGYLSIDTEGSEYEIIKEFDFSAYRFSVITIEHNFTEKRELIYDLLSSKGYMRVLEEVSGQDDWYIHETLKLLFV